MVTNLGVAECAAAQPYYYECVNYALEELNLPNVAMYIDAGTSRSQRLCHIPQQN